MIGRKARNTGHKAIRARAVTDLANYIGWERSHGVFYMGVPDMAVGPLYYSLYDAACVRINAEFPEDAGKNLRQTNQTPLSPREVEEMLDLLMTADQDTVFDLITAHLKSGKSIKSLGDTIQIGAAELILRTTVPRQFTNGQHPFDYCNVANNWMRTHRQSVPGAHPVSDGEFHQRRRAREQAADAGHRQGGRRRSISPARRRRRCSARSTRRSWRSTARAPPRWPTPICAPGRDRRPYMETVALAACRFQDDPHNQKITISTFEEYGHNSTHLRDRLLLATPRLLAGWVKMPGERDCFARFEKEWIYN